MGGENQNFKIQNFEELGSVLESHFEEEKSARESLNIEILFRTALEKLTANSYFEAESKVNSVEYDILENILDNSWWDRLVHADLSLTERIGIVDALKSELKALRQLAILKSIRINDVSKADLDNPINKPDKIKTLDQEQIYGLLRVTQINPELKFNVKFSDLYEAQKEHLATLGWESVAPFLKPVDGQNEITLESAPSTDVFWRNAEFFANLPDDFTIKVGDLAINKDQFRMIADLQARGYSEFKIDGGNIQYKNDTSFVNLPTTSEELAAITLKVSPNGFDTLELSSVDFNTLCRDSAKKAELIGKIVSGLGRMPVLDRGALINFINLMRSSSNDALSERLVFNNVNSRTNLIKSLNVCVFAPMGLKVEWNADEKTLKVTGVCLADVPEYEPGVESGTSEFSHFEPRLASVDEEFSFADLGIYGFGVTYSTEVLFQSSQSEEYYRMMQVSRTMANLDNELITAQNETILREFGLYTTRERFEGGIVKLTAKGNQEVLMQSGELVVGQNDFEYSFSFHYFSFPSR